MWATDITYIPIARGFVYLAAIMDWSSRKVLSWQLSNTMDSDFCMDALKKRLIVMVPLRYSIPIRVFSSPEQPLLAYLSTMI